MIEITNNKYSPVRLFLDGEARSLAGRGGDNKIKVNVDEIEQLSPQVLDLIKGGMLSAKKIARRTKVDVPASPAVKEESSEEIDVRESKKRS